MFEVAVDNDFDFLSREYRALFAASEATAFQHPVWLSELYRGLLSFNNARPLIIAIRRSGALAGVLPLVKRRYGALRVIEFADLRVSDYAAPVTDRATLTSMLADSAIRRQIRGAVGSFDLLRVGKIRDGALPIHRLFGIAEPTAMPTNAYAVALGSSYEAWATTALNASYGRELEKKARQLARAGDLRFERVAGPELLPTFEALRIFRRDRFEKTSGGELLQVPAYYDFYRRIAGAEDFARTYRMTLNGEIIAAALGLAYRGELLVVLSGFTQTAYKNRSIGSLLFREIARDSIASGDKLLDFTIGDEPYKMTFGGVPSPMWQISRAGSPFGFAAAVLVDRLPAARALARSIFHRNRRRGPNEPPASGGLPATVPSEPVEIPARS